MIDQARFFALRNPNSGVVKVGAFESVGQYIYAPIDIDTLQDALSNGEIFRVQDPAILALFSSLGPDIYYFPNNPLVFRGLYTVPN